MVLINFSFCKTDPLDTTQAVMNRTETLDHNTAICLAGEALSCRRGERLLFEDLNFSVSGGQCLHVTGANGSGKTSLLRMLCGISYIDHGEIHWNQVRLGESDDFFSQLAYIGHKDGLKNELTAVENLEFYQRLNSAADTGSVDQALLELGILQCAELTTFQLSFGQRRRLAFARLLLHPCKLWILDEPFTGIDKQGRQLIEELCLTHLKDGGIIVLTNHQSLHATPLAAHLSELSLS